MEKRMKQLLKIMQNKNQLQEIGLNVIQDRLRRIGEVRKGIKPKGIAIALVFKKGDFVPGGFRGLPGMNFDAKGYLMDDWEDAWCQSGWNESGGWGDTWGECWDNTGPSELAGGIHYGTPVEWVVKRINLDVFSSEERKILKKFGIE
jgi:hypothetical protein